MTTRNSFRIRLDADTLNLLRTLLGVLAAYDLLVGAFTAAVNLWISELAFSFTRAGLTTWAPTGFTLVFAAIGGLKIVAGSQLVIAAKGLGRTQGPRVWHAMLIACVAEVPAIAMTLVATAFHGERDALPWVSAGVLAAGTWVAWKLHATRAPTPVAG